MSEKPLKPYRSKAEKTAVQQRNATIALAVLTLITNILTLLRVFDIL